MTKITLGKNYYSELKKLIKNACADFSGVNVAAIIVTDKGVFKGVNYEDPILNLGICAERSAIFNGITNGMGEIYEIHILSTVPYIQMCGACRQMARTFMKPTKKIYTYDSISGKRKVTTLGHLMPNAVTPSKIKANKKVIYY